MATSNHEIQSSVDMKSVFDSSAIVGEFALNNCEDVHIGPKYENSNNIVINHNFNVSSAVVDYNLKSALKEELEKSRNDLEVQKDSAGRCSILLNPLTIVALSLAIILTIIIFSVYSGKENEFENEKKVITQPPILHSDDYPEELQFVLRETWGASPPVEKQKNNPLPVRRVIFIHTAGSTSCNKFTSCAQIVRSIQELHMDEDHQWGDIGYNFVLGGDGYIYVGVGWDKVGVHTAGFNTGSLAVAFIGDFRTDELNDKMILSAKQLLQHGVKRKKLSEDYQLFGHCQILSGFPYSPGKNIMKVIKEWDHWNDTSFSNCKR